MWRAFTHFNALQTSQRESITLSSYEENQGWKENCIVPKHLLCDFLYDYPYVPFDMVPIWWIEINNEWQLTGSVKNNYFCKHAKFIIKIHFSAE